MQKENKLRTPFQLNRLNSLNSLNRLLTDFENFKFWDPMGPLRPPGGTMSP